MSRSEFVKDLQTVINKHSQERYSNTPDFVLAEYAINCLNAFHIATIGRSHFYDDKTTGDFPTKD